MRDIDLQGTTDLRTWKGLSSNGVIDVISREAVVGGESSAKRKAYLRSIHNIETRSKKSRPSLPITFLEEDLEGILMPYDDPVIVLTIIVNFKVWKILVDNRNNVDILFYEAFQWMKFLINRLMYTRSLLYGFIGETIMPEGIIALLVLLEMYL